MTVPLLLDTLEAHRQAFTVRLDALDPATVHTSPAPGGWSLAQLTEHLLLIDSGLRFDGPPASGLAATTSRVRSLGIQAILSLPLRIKGPPSARPVMPSAAPRWGGIRDRWAALRSYWRAASPAAGAVAFRHPIAGPFLLSDALAFLLAHHRHHDAQVRRTLAALARYPALA